LGRLEQAISRLSYPSPGAKPDPVSDVSPDLQSELSTAQFRVRAFLFLRSELELGNLTLVPGGVKPNRTLMGLTLFSFINLLGREGWSLPVGASKTFTQCFSQVVKSQKRKSDPVRQAVAFASNKLRMWRWRLSERMLVIWILINENDPDSARAEKGRIVLATAYMPEIRNENPREFTYLRLAWLSVEAAEIQKQVWALMKQSKQAYSYRYPYDVLKSFALYFP
jgi:hypothetical protein